MPRVRVSVVFALVLALPGLAVAAGPPVCHVDYHGDRLPAGAVARLGSVRWRAENITAYALVPGGNLLAAAHSSPGSDGWATALTLWDLDSGRRVRMVVDDVTQDKNGFETGLVFTPDGRRLLTADSVHVSNVSFDRRPRREPTILFWEVPSGRLVARSPALSGEPAHIALSRDGKLAACGTYQGEMVVWSPGASKLRRLHKGDRDTRYEAVAFSPDRKHLVVVLKSGKFECLRIAVDSGKVEQRIPLGDQGRVALSSDGSRVATYDDATKLLLFDTVTGKSRRLVYDVQVRYLEVAFSDDDNTLLTADHWHDKALIWDVAKGQLLRVVPVPGLSQTDQSPGLRITNDGKSLFTTQTRRLVRLWDGHTGKPRSSFPGHVKAPSRVAFTADSREVVSVEARSAASSDVRRWDAATGRTRGAATLTLPAVEGEGTPRARLFSPNGHLLATKTEAKVAHLFDVRTGNRIALRGGEATVTGWAFTPDSRSLILGDSKRSLRFWDTASGMLTRTVDLAKDTTAITWICPAPDGKRVATGENSQKVHLWDASTYKRLTTLIRPDHREPNQPTFDEWETTFSPNGRYLFLSSITNLWVWDVEEGREVGPLEEDEREWSVSCTTSVAVSPDSRLLAWIDSGGAFRLHEIASGRIVARLDGVSRGFAFASTGWRLAAGCEADGSVLIWDLPALFRRGTHDAATPSADALWADLAAADGVRAYRALGRLADHPSAETLIATRLRPTPKPDETWLARQIADLAAASHATREKAERGLADVGEAARLALQQAARTTAELEQRQRLRRLLEGLGTWTPGRLREHRAVLALEARGTAEARRILASLADGAAGARLTVEAKAALARLGDGK